MGLVVRSRIIIALALVLVQPFYMLTWKDNGLKATTSEETVQYSNIMNKFLNTRLNEMNFKSLLKQIGQFYESEIKGQNNKQKEQELDFLKLSVTYSFMVYMDFYKNFLHCVLPEIELLTMTPNYEPKHKISIKLNNEVMNYINNRFVFDRHKEKLNFYKRVYDFIKSTVIEKIEELNDTYKYISNFYLNNESTVDKIFEDDRLGYKYRVDQQLLKLNKYKDEFKDFLEENKSNFIYYVQTLILQDFNFDLFTFFSNKITIFKTEIKQAFGVKIDKFWNMETDQCANYDIAINIKQIEDIHKQINQAQIIWYFALLML